MMRYTLLLALAFGCASATRHYVKPEVVVDFINTKQSSWKAEVKERPIESIAKKLMDVKYTKQPEPEDVAPETPILANIPDAFDARTAWPSCTGIGFIRDQSDCGSCWAFGAAEAMSDRLCIATKGATNLKLSADDLLSCCGKSCGNGCEGGYPIDAWKYWVKNGLVTGGLYGDTTTCRPYEISPCGTHNQTVYPPCPPQEYDTPTCKKECVAGYPKSYVDDKHFGASAYAVSKKVATIQQEIMNNGPVEAAYTVYEDFYYYKSGIYSHVFGGALGGHAVKILGWGVDDQGTPYWLVANSWNTDWGENGFFRILRGVNECGIEGGIVAGMPKN